MPSRTYRNEGAFRRSTAYVHIHNVPHHPSKIEHLKGGKVRVVPCTSCGRVSTHMHGKHGCCGSMACHATLNASHTWVGERETSHETVSFMPKGAIKRGRQDPFFGDVFG